MKQKKQMKTVILTVDITVTIEADVEPNEVTFRGIDDAIPMAGDKDVGIVETYCTQEYFE